MTSWTETDVDAGPVRIHVHRTGNSGQPAVVLIHGFSDSGPCWARTALALGAAFDVVMIDARNHGASATGTGRLSDLAADAAAVITGLELEQPAVVGHSLGAATAAELAADRPDLVCRLVLEDPPWREADVDGRATLPFDLDDVRAYVRSLGEMTDDELLALGHDQHPDWPEAEFPAWVTSKRQVRESAVDGLGVASWSDVVDRIGCPTLLIHGDPERGGLVTPDVAQQVVDANRLVTACMIERSGHNIRRENFDRFIEVVGEFLRRP